MRPTNELSATDRELLMSPDTLINITTITTAKRNEAECFLCPSLASVIFDDGKEKLPVCCDCFTILAKDATSRIGDKEDRS